jgi:putative phosphonoacetaldehyde dehydrogenase
MRIAGEKVDSSSRCDIRFPYTGAVVGSVPQADLSQLEQAFVSAMNYKARLSRHQRSSILTTAARLIIERRLSLAELITAESGLCLQDTQYEVDRVVDVLNLAAAEVLRDDGESYACDLSANGKKRRIITQREPLIGVIVAITPFNHPLNQVAHKIAPAIATNNRVILKPSEKTPLSALAFADILYEAGLPGPMLSVITGSPQLLADAMITHPHADLIAFTGSVAIGKSIATRAGYKRLVLELGGNDPLIVCEDADPLRAAALAVQGSYKNSGQRCTAVKRIFVHNSIADTFVVEVVRLTKLLTYGDPYAPSTQMGCVIDEAAALRCQQRVENAISQHGAHLLTGHKRQGALYAPTVLDHVPHTCELVHEETFGPVAPIIRFDTLEQLIAMSNSTAFGLSSGVCSDRFDIINRLVHSLDVGTVNVWEVPGYRSEMSPFGGIKDSGLGVKEGVVCAIKNYTNVKTVSFPWG